MQKLNLPEDTATLSYKPTKSDFSRDGAVDLAGVRSALKLRAALDGTTPAAEDHRLDLTYYPQALAEL